MCSLSHVISERSSASPRMSVIAACVCKFTSPGSSTWERSAKRVAGANRASASAAGRTATIRRSRIATAWPSRTTPAGSIGTIQRGSIRQSTASIATANKKPRARRGWAGRGLGSLLAHAADVDDHAAVRREALDQRGLGLVLRIRARFDRQGLAHSKGLDLVGGNAEISHEDRLGGFGTLLGQPLVGLLTADAVGMALDDDRFELRTLREALPHLLLDPGPRDLRIGEHGLAEDEVLVRLERHGRVAAFGLGDWRRRWGWRRCRNRLGARNEVRIALHDRERRGPVAGAPAEVERILHDRVAAVADVARRLLRGGGCAEKRADNCRKSDEQSSLVRSHVSSPSSRWSAADRSSKPSRSSRSAVGGRWYTSSFAPGSTGAARCAECSTPWSRRTADAKIRTFAAADRASARRESGRKTPRLDGSIRKGNAARQPRRGDAALVSRLRDERDRRPRAARRARRSQAGPPPGPLRDE